MGLTVDRGVPASGADVADGAQANTPTSTYKTNIEIAPGNRWSMSEFYQTRRTGNSATNRLISGPVLITGALMFLVVGWLYGP